MLHSIVQRDLEVVTPLPQLAHVLTSTFVQFYFTCRNCLALVFELALLVETTALRPHPCSQNIVKAVVDSKL